MFDKFKNLFGNKAPGPQITDDEYQQFADLKEQGLERVLGKMYDLVGHAIIPFQIGGAVDMYYFPNILEGTGFATMELIEPDESGPLPSKIGTYELVAFTRLHVGDETTKDAFSQIERRMCGIFTALGNYSYEAKLNPHETVEVPGHQDEPNRCLILDEFRRPGVDFRIGNSKHGLLLVIEVFRSEMEYAMNNGAKVVLDGLKAKGYYPYSDLDREPLF